jgi:hypothetical protein
MNLEHNWYNVTTWAERDWRDAQACYWEDLHRYRGDPRALAVVHERIAAQRKSYRDRVLSWYRKLHLPMKLGDAVPNRVAELLAEEWDIATLP